MLEDKTRLTPINISNFQLTENYCNTDIKYYIDKMLL